MILLYRNFGVNNFNIRELPFTIFLKKYLYLIFFFKYFLFTPTSNNVCNVISYFSICRLLTKFTSTFSAPPCIKFGIKNNIFFIYPPLNIFSLIIYIKIYRIPNGIDAIVINFLGDSLKNLIFLISMLSHT